MKRVTLWVLFVIGLLAISGLAMAQQENTRYFVKSTDDSLKAKYGVHHTFDKGFTTQLSKEQVKTLQKLGVEVEKVAIYRPLTMEPPCGDGICQGKETPESCPEDCMPERTCFPTLQIPLGVDTVNGGSGGAGVKVAVLDTGVNTRHPDLIGSVDHSTDCQDTTGDVIEKGCGDFDGHGTHVAGTILANGGADGLGIYGVAPEASLMALRVCDNYWFGVGCYADDIAEGIYYATDNGAQIISMSLGGSIESSVENEAIAYAVVNGVLVVAAAGNSGPAEDSIGYPAANPNVVAVGAVYHTNYDQTFVWFTCTDIEPSAGDIACWTSRGINDGNDDVISEREVELAAPGVFVESSYYYDNCYRTYSGTSMATPHISGLAAKLWQGDGASTRAYLRSIAVDIGDDGYDTASGYGIPIAPTEP